MPLFKLDKRTQARHVKGIELFVLACARARTVTSTFCPTCLWRSTTLNIKSSQLKPKLNQNVIVRSLITGALVKSARIGKVDMRQPKDIRFKTLSPVPGLMKTL